MKVKRLGGLIALAILTAVGWLFWRNGNDGGSVSEGAGEASSRKTIAARKSSAGRQAKASGRSEADDGEETPWGRVKPSKDWIEELPSADRKLAEAVQEASDADNWKATSKAAAQALRSANPEVRKLAVEALSSFGQKALAELTPCMGDPDEEVAELAIDRVGNALTEINAADSQFLIAASYLATFKANVNAIRMLSGVMTGAASQMAETGNAERDLKNRNLAVDALAQIVEGGGKAAEEAKEVYNTLTSHDWLGVEEAKLWASDPDNYETPEEAEEAAEDEAAQGDGPANDGMASE